jgi:N-acetylglucosamine-6-phosphate deacetylase
VMKLALRAKRHDRLMLVTDAMPSVGSDLTSFRIQGRLITVAGDKIMDESGGLAGAHLDMATAVRNAVKLLGAGLADALFMGSRSPAEFLRLENLGRLAPGKRANLVLLDDDLQVHGTWIDGSDT